MNHKEIIKNLKKTYHDRDLPKLYDSILETQKSRIAEDFKKSGIENFSDYKETALKEIDSNLTNENHLVIGFYLTALHEIDEKKLS